MTHKWTVMAGLGVLAMSSLAACGAAPSASAATYPLGSPVAANVHPNKPAQHQAVKVKPQIKAKAKTKKVKAPQFPGIPDFVPRFQPKNGQVFQAIARINHRYIAWGDAQIAVAVPGIPATGPLAGTLTPQVMNSAAVLAKWDGPAIPTSPAAVGAVIKPNPALTYLGWYPANGKIPANGSVTGLSVSTMQTVLSANPWLHITPNQLMAAYQVAGEYTMALFSNDPLSSFRYLDPYGYGGHNDQSFIQGIFTRNVAYDFTAPGYKGGVLPLRQYVYQSFVNYQLTKGTFYQVEKPLYPETQPKGDVVASVIIADVSPTVIGSGLYTPNGRASIHGHLEIGMTTPQAHTVALSLIRSGTVERWYVTEANVGGGNSTAQTFWKAP